MAGLHPTKIQWATHSVNPLYAVNLETGKRGWACTKVAEGCKNCYAEVLNRDRFGTGLPFDVKSESLVRWGLDEEALQSVLRRKKPATIFWCDMTDLFHERVPDEWLDRCFAVMALTPHLRHLVLTKRPERMFPWFSSSPWDELRIRRMFTAAMVGQPRGLIPHFKTALSAFGWPLPNVAFGTSVSNQDDADRNIPHLIATPAALRFISLEPQVEAVDLENVDFWSFYERLGTLKPRTSNDPMLIFDALRGHMKGPDDVGLTKLDVIIIGGESGPKARPFDPAWARSTIAQCEAAGVVAMVKQLGANVHVHDTADMPYDIWRGWDSDHAGEPWPPNGVHMRLINSHGADPSEWPEDLRPYAASVERWPW